MASNDRIVTELALNVKTLQDGLAQGVRAIEKAATTIARAAENIAATFEKTQPRAVSAMAKANTEALRQQKIIIDTARSASQAKEAESKAITAAENAKVAALRASQTQEASLEKARRSEYQSTINKLREVADAARKNSADLIQSAQASLKQNAKEGPAGSYRNLAYQTTELRKQLLTLPGAFDAVTGAINRNNPAAVNLQKQILQNTNALKNADAQLGNYQRNVGNYKSGFASIGKSALSAVGGLVGITSAFETLRGAINIIDRMDRLNASIRNVSKSAQDYAANQNFLRQTARESAIDVETLSQSFRGFYVSATAAGQSAETTRKTFGSFSKAFAALKIDSATAGRAFTALEQMFSKGKVSSEELRQQLGEALPGAVALFAKALNVSQAELFNMLKNGEVLASDVLPKVAAQLEATYGSKAQGNLATISGSFTNLTNEAKIFLDTLNEDRAVSGFFSSLNNFLADSLRNAQLLVKALGPGGLTAPTLFRGSALNEELKRVQAENEAQGFGTFGKFRKGTTSDQSKIIRAQNAEIQKQTAEVVALKKQWAQLTDAEERYTLGNQINIKIRGINALINGNKKFIKIQEEQRKALEGDEFTQMERFESSLRNMSSPERLNQLKKLTTEINAIKDGILKGTANQADKNQLKTLQEQAKLVKAVNKELKPLNAAKTGRTSGERFYDFAQYEKALAGLNVVITKSETHNKTLEMRASLEERILGYQRLQISERAQQLLIDKDRLQTEAEIAKYVEKQNKPIKTNLGNRSAFGSDSMGVNKGSVANQYDRLIGKAILYGEIATNTFHRNDQEVISFKQSLGAMGEVYNSIGIKLGDLDKRTRNVFAGLGVIGNEVFGGLIDAFQEFYTSGQFSLKGVIKTLGQLITKLAAAATVAGILALATGGSFSTFFGGFTGIDIPEFAKGGIVTKPTYGLFGEAGPEAVIPLNKLNNFMGNGIGDGQTIVTKVMLNDKEIASAVNRVNYNDNRSR